MAEWLDWNRGIGLLPREYLIEVLLQEIAADKNVRLNFFDAAHLINQDSLAQLQEAASDPASFLYEPELSDFCTDNGLVYFLSGNFVQLAADSKGSAEYEDSSGIAIFAAPTTGHSPTIYSYDADRWIFFFERPHTGGLWANNLEFRMENAGEGFDVKFMLGNTTAWIEPKRPFSVEVTYRWRNHYRDGGSDGWSLYSPTATAHGTLSGSDNDPYDAATGYDNDPDDGSLT